MWDFSYSISQLSILVTYVHSCRIFAILHIVRTRNTIFVIANLRDFSAYKWVKEVRIQVNRCIYGPLMLSIRLCSLSYML